MKKIKWTAQFSMGFDCMVCSGSIEVPNSWSDEKVGKKITDEALSRVICSIEWEEAKESKESGE